MPHSNVHYHDSWLFQLSSEMNQECVDWATPPTTGARWKTVSCSLGLFLGILPPTVSTSGDDHSPAVSTHLLQKGSSKVDMVWLSKDVRVVGSQKVLQSFYLDCDDFNSLSKSIETSSRLQPLKSKSEVKLWNSETLNNVLLWQPRCST